MKVLFITNMYPTTQNPKAGTFIEQQIKSLSAKGLDHKVVLIDRANLGPIQYARTISIVKEKCTEFKPDLVHVMYGGVLAAASTFAVKGIPRIVSFCGVDLLGANYGPFRYQVRTKLGVLASRYAARNCEGIIVKSQNLKNGLPATVSHIPTRIIPNGVCFNRFKPLDQVQCREDLNWNKDDFIVLFSTNSKTNAKKRLWLAEDVVSTVRDRGYQNIQIKGLHKVAHDQVPIWINAADMTLLTSMYDEGSPNIIKETLLCDKPVVSLDVGDVRERINGVKGCYLCDENIDELADAIISVIEGQRTVSGRLAMTDLSLDAVAENVINFYRQILSSRK